MRHPRPTTLQIGQITYQVEDTDPTDKLMGSCSVPWYHTIRTDGDYYGLEQIDTLLHEIIHAVDDQFRSKLTERQTMGIATGLAHVFYKNPALIKFMQSQFQIEQAREQTKMRIKNDKNN